MKRLTGLDAGFLYMETPAWHMHVGGFGIFEPVEGQDPASYERMVEMTEARIHMAPVFRERLATVPFQLHHPVWVDDPDFDVRYHVRRIALPSPGGPHELAEAVGDIFSRQLDRSRPLWELYFVEGLEGERWASVTKTHHAAVDGISGVELSMLLMDMEPTPAAVEPPPDWEPERVPTDWELLAYGLNSRLRSPVGAWKVARSLTRVARDTIARRNEPKAPDLTPPPSPFSAPRTSLNGTITPHRVLSFTSVPLDDLKALKSAYECTVNDIVLAICAGALKRYFDEHDESLDGPLVASVPVSVRTEDESGALGNRVTTMLTTLATDVDDVAERVAAIRSGTRGAKEGLDAVGADTLTDLTEFTPPGLMIQAARLAARTKIADRMRPIYNFTISNVPGPQFPLYSLGSKMTLMSPLGPITDSSALNITVASYDGDLAFGFQACRQSIDDVWFFEGATHDAVAELQKAAPS